MPGRGNVRFFFDSRAVTFVGAEAATTPPSEGSAVGVLIVIPVPPGTQDGDHLFAVTSSSFGVTTPPAGWAELTSLNVFTLLWYRVAASEPASYTWTTELEGGRSGCMASIRGGLLGDTGEIEGGGVMTCPDVTASIAAGGIFLGFVGIGDSENDEDFTVTGSHVIKIQHSGTSPGAYTVPRSTAISLQSGLTSVQTVGSGNTFIDAAAASAFRGRVSVIVDLA